MTATDAAYWQSTAQDLAEALRGLVDEHRVHHPGPGYADVNEALDRAEALFRNLTYDEPSSASSQNYIDTGVRLLAEPAPPEVIVGYVDAGDDEEEIVVDDGFWRHGQLVIGCPWKGCESANAFYEIDVAERWNDLMLDDSDVDVQPDRLSQFDRYVDGRPVYRDAGPNPLAGLPIVGVREGGTGDGYSTDRYACSACGRTVSLPDWLETSWG